MRKTAPLLLSVVLLVAGLAVTGHAAGAATAPPNLDAVKIKLKVAASGLDRPVALAWRRGDSRMYVAEQSGTVRSFAPNGKPYATPVLSLTGLSHGGEQGLLGLAFSPDGKKLYVDYTDASGDTHVDEYAFAKGVAVVSSKRPLLFVDQPDSNHNGGELIFGADNMLYVGLGDGGGGGDPNGNGQKLTTLLGKILRIDPKPSATLPYTIPADNPFVGTPGARGEIWNYGARNPWRFSFDRLNHDFWLGEVGQELYEEIDYAAAGTGAGANWGWNQREGLHPYKGGAQPPDGRDPIVELPHADGYCAVVGGYVYRARTVRSLYGAYVFSDNCRSELVGLVYSGGQVVAQKDLGVSVPGLSTFGESRSGQLYVASLDGTVYRLIQG